MPHVCTDTSLAWSCPRGLCFVQQLAIQDELIYIQVASPSKQLIPNPKTLCFMLRSPKVDSSKGRQASSQQCKAMQSIAQQTAL